MREDATMCSWCRRNSDDTMDRYYYSSQMTDQDPCSALGPPNQQSSSGKMAEGVGRLSEPDRGIPRHAAGSEKQLHSGTGYNVVVDSEGAVYGTREPYNSEAVLRFHSRAPGEVQIKGKVSNLYLAMNEKGKVYGECNKESENTWFQEIYEDGWSSYMWLGNKKDWFLGIKKSGDMKKGHRTKKGQKAVKFVPRSAEPLH